MRGGEGVLDDAAIDAPGLTVLGGELITNLYGNEETEGENAARPETNGDPRHCPDASP